MTKTSTPTKLALSRSSSSIPVAVDTSSSANGPYGSSKKQIFTTSSQAGNCSSSLGQTDVKDTLKSASSSSLLAPTPLAAEICVGTNENILADISEIYNHKATGLIQTAKVLNVESQINKPRKKVTILLIGNHSAGKSSFINWYIQEPVLKTGVATETQGVTLLVSGSKSETLKGAATLELFPHLKKLKKIPGLVNNLVTEVSPSRSRNFDLVTFIDTPGLVDGNMNYPFDINKTLVTLGELADQIFVFFEPIGQALCKRTLDILEEMWSKHGDSKIKMYLAKADEAGGDRDRQKVSMQIVQELCKRPGINRTAFDMPAIYIPSSMALSSDAFGRNNKLGLRCSNQIEEVCKEIKRAVGMNVQNALENLSEDCSALKHKLRKRIDEDAASRKINSEKRGSKFLQSSMAFFLLVLAASGFAAVTANGNGFWGFRYVGQLFENIFAFLGVPFMGLWLIIPEKLQAVVLALFVVYGMTLWFLSGRITYEEVLPNKKREEMQSALKFIEIASKKQTSLFRIYLKQSMPDLEVEEGGDTAI